MFSTQDRIAITLDRFGDTAELSLERISDSVLKISHGHRHIRIVLGDTGLVCVEDRGFLAGLGRIPSSSGEEANAREE